MKDFLNIFNALSADTLHRLEEIYSTDIHFVDPAHEIVGIEQLRDYFTKLYANVISVNFDFHEEVVNGSCGYVQWDMHFAHPRLKGGRPITVPGASFLRFDTAGKASFHRDYFDLGSMLYQHLPLLGGVVRSINRRLGS